MIDPPRSVRGLAVSAVVSVAAEKDTSTVAASVSTLRVVASLVFAWCLSLKGVLRLAIVAAKLVDARGALSKIT